MELRTRHGRAAKPATAALTFLAMLSQAGTGFAQCASNASSCVACHETEARRPVLAGAAPWHRDHGFGDLCVACHGGDPAATREREAHTGLRPPLAQPEVTCDSCHARRSQALAPRYVAVLDRFRAPPAAPPGARAPTPGPAAPSRIDAALSVAAVLLAGSMYLFLRRRDGAARRRFVAWLRAPSWSPFAAGAWLGGVVTVAEVWYARPLAVSGAFDKLAAYPGRWLFPGSQYYGHVMSPGIGWSVWVVLGIFIGAYASAKLSGTATKRWLPEAQWQSRFGSARATRLAIAFVGAALVQIGAGIAGGCTSGLAISGGALLAPAAFTFMAGMFAAGIVTARLWYRKERP